MTLTIEEMRDIARSRGGECLSEKYINSKTKLRWRCSEGHEWEAIPNNVKRGSWCPNCKMRIISTKLISHTIEEMRDIARSRGGECLSEKYINSKTKLRWRCSEGHEWEALRYSIEYSWCPYCSKNKRLTIEEMRDIARSRGGECLSEKYINSKTKLRWRCSEGHEWEANYNHIQRGQWCSICSSGISEKICKKIFEDIFNKKFPKVRPSWLKNPYTGGHLELDGYNESDKIAFEYNGIQHYKNIDYFQCNRDTQKKRDEYKKLKCIEKGITLIEIPFWIIRSHLYEYIVKECVKMNLIKGEVKIKDYRQLDIYNAIFLDEMKIIARSRGGECLSSSYISCETKLRWRCSEGHEWEAIPTSIKRGSWCLICQKKNTGMARRLTIEEMRDIARSRGGECLSEKYINSKTKLRWRCSEGHEWEAIPNNVKNHHRWCPFCYVEKRKKKKRPEP